MSTAKLSPSYFGYVGSTKDALLIIQEIIDKQLELVPRRPIERERPHLIKSGNVFVFIEEHSGIKRWTDGIAWCPSRILGRFLVYRELDKHSQNEKDDTKKKKRKVSVDRDPLDTSYRPQLPQGQEVIRHESYDYSSTAYNKKNLMGSLVTSYVFKDQGLIKKTLSLLTSTKDLHLEKRNEKQTIHLISYYNADDVLNGKLKRPSETDLKNIPISNALWNAVKDSSLGGKIPIEDEAYYFLDTNYQLQNMSLLQQAPKQRQDSPVQYLPQKYQSSESFNRPSNVSRPLTHQSLLYMLAGPTQEHDGFSSIDSSNAITKREDETITNVNLSAINEMAFINPFTGAPHQINLGYNNQQAVQEVSNGGGTPAAGSGPPLFNMVPPQQFSSYPQAGDPRNNTQGATGGMMSHYPLFPQHFSQQVYPQLGLQPGGYHFGSHSGSREQFSLGGGGASGTIPTVPNNPMTTSSISSTSTANSSSAKKYYRNSSGNSTSGIPNNAGNYNSNGNAGWFTTNPPVNSYQPLTGDLSESLTASLAPDQHQIHHHPGGSGNYGGTQSLHGTHNQGLLHHYVQGHYSHNNNANNSDT